MTRRARLLSLSLIVVVTAALWSGVSSIELNGDDYQYIASMAPMRTFGDALRPFVSNDANPSYYRPFANVSLATNFLLWHYDGGPYHLTNLFLHLIATVIVFYFGRRIFRLTDISALVLAAAFGIAASHEYNLVVDTARADILVAIFAMLAILAEQRAIDRSNTGYRVAALVCFAFALLSKESALFVLPLIAWFAYPPPMPAGSRIRTTLKIIAPYIVIAIAYYFVHRQYTSASAESQLFDPRALVAGVRDALIGAAYILLPLDFSTAMNLAGGGLAPIIGIAAIILFLAVLAVFRMRHVISKKDFLKPVALYILTTVPLLSFGRWRYYLPSVALLAIIVMLLDSMWRRGKAEWIVVMLFVLPFTVFHTIRARTAQADWQQGTHLLQEIKTGLKPLLDSIPQRPLRLAYITCPAKIASGNILQLGKSAIAQRAEADRISQQNAADGSTHGVQVSAWSAVDVYAFDREAGFAGLHCERIAQNRYIISRESDARLLLAPGSQAGGSNSVLSLRARVGDTVASDECLYIVRSTDRGRATSVEIDVRDSGAIPLYFDGRTFTRLYRSMQ